MTKQSLGFVSLAPGVIGMPIQHTSGLIPLIMAVAHILC